MNIDIKQVLEFYRTASTDELAGRAEEVSRENHKNKVLLRGLIEFSNYCIKNCLYCGIRMSNIKVNRYRLTDELIIDTVRAGFSAGLRTFVLQSGEDSYYSTAVLTGLVEKIKNATGGEAAITLSCGIRSKEDYLSLKIAGCGQVPAPFRNFGPRPSCRSAFGNSP